MARGLPPALLFCIVLAACGGGPGGSSLPSAESRSSTLSAATGAAGPLASSAAFNDWPTYGYDNARDGFNPNSAPITPASLASLHLAWEVKLNTAAQTQPIVATNVGGHSAVVIVGTGSGDVHAYDAQTGASIWTRSFGRAQFSCGSSQFYLGIGGTPAYAASSKSLYLTANVNTAPDSPAENRMYHLDAATGATLGSLNVTAPLLPGEQNFAHTAVTLSPNGLVYTGTGSFCDIASARGRVAAIRTSDMSLANTFFTTWNRGGPYAGGGVWGWGGVSLDDSDNVFAGVGNTFDSSVSNIKAPFAAAPSETSAYGDSVLKLSPDLILLSSNSPGFAFDGHTKQDLDFTGTPTLFRPVGCHTMTASQGKAGQLVIYGNHLGAGPITRYQLSVSTHKTGYLGNPSYSPLTGLLYAAVSSSEGGSIEPPGMIAIKPSGCNAFDILWTSAFGPDSFSFSQPLSRTAPTPTAGGVVLIGTPCYRDTSGGCGGPSGSTSGAVWAVNASTGLVLNSGKPILRTGATLRMAPVVDGQWIWVYDSSGNLYGLTTNAASKAIASPREVNSVPLMIPNP